MFLAVAQHLFGAFAFDHQGDLARDKGQNILIALGVAQIMLVGLHHQSPQDFAVPAAQGHAQPVHRISALLLHLTRSHQLVENLRRGQQRAAGAQHVFGQPAADALRFGGAVKFIHKVGEVDLFAFFIQQGDVEIVRRNQIADDGMHRKVELIQVFHQVHGLRNAVQGLFQLFGPFALADVAERNLQGWPPLVINGHHHQLHPGLVGRQEGFAARRRPVCFLFRLPPIRKAARHPHFPPQVIAPVQQIQRLAEDIHARIQRQV